MKIPKVLVTVAAASLLAGCGGSDDKTPSAVSSSSQNAAEIAKQLSQCIRTNGVPGFPDLIQDSNGSWNVPAGTPLPPDAAQTACKSLSDQLPSGGSSGEAPKQVALSTKQLTALRKWSQCVRQEGGVSDWPDPDSNGLFTLPARLASDKGIAKRVTDLAACASLRPQGVGLKIGTEEKDGG